MCTNIFCWVLANADSEETTEPGNFSTKTLHKSWAFESRIYQLENFPLFTLTVVTVKWQVQSSELSLRTLLVLSTPTDMTYNPTCPSFPPSIPGTSAACAIRIDTSFQNNTFVFKTCCNGAPILSFYRVGSPAHDCFQYCNITSSMTFKDTRVYECIRKSNISQFPCPDQETSSAEMREVRLYRILLGFMAVVMSRWVFEFIWVDTLLLCMRIKGSCNKLSNLLIF